MRASDIAGMDFESFKEVLTDRGKSIMTATPTEKEMEEEVKYLDSPKRLLPAKSFVECPCGNILRNLNHYACEMKLAEKKTMGGQ